MLIRRDDTRPLPSWGFEMTDKPTGKTPKVLVAFLGSDIARFTGVLVECWDHKGYGRMKRLYLKTFTEPERKVLSALHTRAWLWTMQSGHPDYIQMKLATYDLLVRAANFFAAEDRR